MIIIVEGIDRCGKTTFINKMCEQIPDLIRFKDVNVCSKTYSDEDFKSFSLGKLDTSIAILKQLSEQGFNIIVDRLHLTELVYGSIERKSTSYREIGQLDNILAKLDCILVLVEPTDLKWSNEQAEKDQTEHYHAFKSHYINSAIEKYHTNFNDLDNMVKILIQRILKINIDTANKVILRLRKDGRTINNTTELLNANIRFHDITTTEILKTFNIDLSLSMNFEYDVRNKLVNKYGPYEIEKYHDIFDKIVDATKYLVSDNINTRRSIIQFDKEHCFQTIQFLIRENKLYLICNMRSCNAIENFKSDVYICSLLADEFKNTYIRMFHSSLDQTHTIIMNIGSFHIFKQKEEDEDASE